MKGQPFHVQHLMAFKVKRDCQVRQCANFLKSTSWLSTFYKTQKEYILEYSHTNIMFFSTTNYLLAAIPSHVCTRVPCHNYQMGFVYTTMGFHRHMLNSNPSLIAMSEGGMSNPPNSPCPPSPPFPPSQR